MPTYTEIRVAYRAFPYTRRPWRVELGTAAMHGPRQFVTACATAKAANAAGERASTKHGLPFTPWKGAEVA